jgi:hypothetical protein
MDANAPMTDQPKPKATLAQILGHDTGRKKPETPARSYRKRLTEEEYVLYENEARALKERRANALKVNGVLPIGMTHGTTVRTRVSATRV